MEFLESLQGKTFKQVKDFIESEVLAIALSGGDDGHWLGTIFKETNVEQTTFFAAALAYIRHNKQCSHQAIYEGFALMADAVKQAGKGHEETKELVENHFNEVEGWLAYHSSFFRLEKKDRAAKWPIDISKLRKDDLMSLGNILLYTAFLKGGDVSTMTNTERIGFTMAVEHWKRLQKELGNIKIKRAKK